MGKKELNISSKKLYPNTKESIIFRSPARIPNRGLQALLTLNKIQGTNIAYYDISPTENQAIKYGVEVNTNIFNDSSPYISSLSVEERNQKMGEIGNI